MTPDEVVVRADAPTCPAPTRAHFLAVTLLGRDWGPFLGEKVEKALDRLTIDRSEESRLMFEGIPIGVVASLLASVSELPLTDREYSEGVLLAARTRLVARYGSIGRAHREFISVLEEMTFPKDRKVTEGVLRMEQAIQRYQRTERGSAEGSNT